MKRKKKSTKSRYCIRNWQQYDIALQQRGSLTFWIGEDALRDWTTQEKSGQRGACITYTDLAIKTMATVQAVFHLAQRQTEGFLNSVFLSDGSGAEVAGHTTWSRRLGQLEAATEEVEESAPRGGGLNRGESLWGGRMEGPTARLE
jgi:hypothetical protein